MVPENGIMPLSHKGVGFSYLLTSRVYGWIGWILGYIQLVLLFLDLDPFNYVLCL